MPRLDVTRAARADLDAIYDYGTEQFGAGHAGAYADILTAAINRLRDFPLSAPALPDRADGTRGLAIGSHLIVYRLDGDVVRIVRVLHRRMDPARHL